MKKSPIHCITDRFYLYRLSNFRRNPVCNIREIRIFAPLNRNLTPKKESRCIKAVAQGPRVTSSSQEIPHLEVLWQKKSLQHCWPQLWTRASWITWGQAVPTPTVPKKMETTSGLSLPIKGSQKDPSSLVEEPRLRLFFQGLSSTAPCPSDASPISQLNGKLPRTRMPPHHKSTLFLCISKESGCYF